MILDDVSGIIKGSQKSPELFKIRYETCYKITLFTPFSEPMAIRPERYPVHCRQQIALLNSVCISYC